MVIGFAGGFFVGGPPTDAEGDFMNYNLFMGRKQDGKPTSATKAGPRSVSTQGDVSLRLMKLLVNYQGHGVGAGRVTKDYVEEVLAASQ